MKIIGLILPERLLAINKYNLLIFIFCFYSCHSLKGQQESSIVGYDSLTQKNVYVFVEKMPSYKGGEVVFMSDFIKSFHYDFSKNKEEPIQTKLQVQFVIDTKGDLIGARIYNKETDELTDFEKAGLKALSSMQNWQIGVHRGKAVNVILTRVINIDMNNL